MNRKLWIVLKAIPGEITKGRKKIEIEIQIFHRVRSMPEGPMICPASFWLAKYSKSAKMLHHVKTDFNLTVARTFPAGRLLKSKVSII